MRQTGARPPVRDSAPLARSNQSRLPPAPAAVPGSNAFPNRQPSNNLDDALLRELEVTFDAGPPASAFDAGPSASFDPNPPKSAPKPVEMTLDDEMTKLLGELSNNKR